MKHPALTRLFSVVLVILCLTMLIAGLGSIAGAVSDREKGMADYERLRARVDEYREVQNALTGKTKYEDANRVLLEDQARHDDLASKHRVNLAMYTATKGGLLEGEAALAEAKYVFYKGKSQYEEGLKLFEEQEAAFWEGYEQFQEGKRQLEEARKTLEMAESALAGLRGQLQQIRSLGAILDSDDPAARQNLSLAAYDGLLQSLDSALGLYNSLKDQGGISPEQMQQIIALLDQETDADLSELLGDVAWEGISAEDLQELEDRVSAATGMSIGEIRQQIQQRRDSIAQMDWDATISEEEFAALQAGYAMARNWLLAIEGAMEEKISEYEAKVAEIRSQLDAAQAQIDELDPVMEQGKAAIEQGRAALDQAGAQIREGEIALDNGIRQLAEKRAELAEQEKKLRIEKAELDAESAALTKEITAVEEQHDRERKEVSLRMLLLDREEIADRVDSGMELLDAAEETAEVLLRQTDRETAGRLRIGVLMIAGALAAFFAVPAAFEKIKSRFLLIVPVLGCFACAVAAEILCRRMGRGDTYSSLAAAFFALVLLLVSVPKKKTAH